MWKLDKAPREDRPVGAISKNRKLLYTKSSGNGYGYRSTILGDGNYLSYDTYRKNLTDPTLEKVYRNSRVTFDLRSREWFVETPESVHLGYFDHKNNEVYLYNPGALEGVNSLLDEQKVLPGNCSWIMRGDILTWEL